MDVTKKHYEISLWEDKLYWLRKPLKRTTVAKDDYETGQYFSQNADVQGAVPYTLDYEPYDEDKKYYVIDSRLASTLPKKEGFSVSDTDLDENDKAWEEVDSTVFSYYKEYKICVIGTHSMDTPIRATKPKFTSKINGENTLTFTVYSHYWSEDSQQLEPNPYMMYLTNERKVKLQYDGEWYDFIIKNISEDSSTKAFTYTCKDLFVNELSKTGFELVFDNELGNNMGNLPYLAKKILEGSDWKLEEEKTETVLQYLEDSLYSMTLSSDLSVNAEYSNAGYSQDKTISAGEKIYVFYNSINFTDSEQKKMQFLYDPTQEYKADDKNVIIGYSALEPTGAINCTLEGVVWEKIEDDYNSYWIPYKNGDQLSQGYPVFEEQKRGERIVKSQKTYFDPKLNRTVKLYNEGTVCGFEETDYVSPVAVQSYVANPSDFTSTTGWYVGKTDKKENFPKLELEVYPALTSKNFDDYDGANYLEFTPQATGQVLMNSGIQNNRTAIGSFNVAEEYILKIDAYATLGEDNVYPGIAIYEYDFTDGVYSRSKTQDLFSLAYDDEDDNYTCTCNYSLSEEEFKNTKIGIFITIGAEDSVIYIKNLEFYPKKTINNAVVEPGSTLNAEVKTVPIYYLKDSAYTSREDLQTLSPNETYNPYYGDTETNPAEPYEKVRSITAKESNRFNLLQTLCELFQQWACFKIDHQPSGEITLDENFHQQKWVSYKKYIGQDNHIGFRYGFNLKSIKRTLDSNGTISKIIVKDNANDLGSGGFCSIARALENPSGENTIFNFDYYVGQRLINGSTLNLDLYGQPGTAQGYLGYYRRLKTQNDNGQKLIEELAGLGNDLSQAESQYQVYKISVEAAEQDKADQEIKFRDTTGIEFATAIKEKPDDWDWWDNKEVQKIRAAIVRDKVVIKNHTDIRDNQEVLRTAVQNKITAKEAELKQIRTIKLGINKEFYQKYSRFIQEGSWIKEDYYDDNLYYMDALSTLYTSSRPQVKYTIDVIELSALEDYKDIKFALGDKTFIQDKEFFGYAYDGTRLYREEVIVSEITIELDSPESNKLTVQNYKTQFEDLFQRVVATTQQIQFSTGEYKRGAAIVEANGTINPTTLQNSFLNNALTIQNARDQSVIIGDDGITTTNLSRPSEMLRIVSGGLFISGDGGQTWTTGISANGINANCITTGQLNVSEVNLTMGSEVAFRWDSLGISAYKRDDTGISPGTFTRFDQFGLYGVNGTSNFDPLEYDGTREGALQSIKNTAFFGLTWDEFWLRSSGVDGYVSISSERDFQVIRQVTKENGETDEVPIIQIGRLGEGEQGDYYGIRISSINEAGEAAVALETFSDGHLWLRDKLSIEATTENGTQLLVGLGKLGKEDSSVTNAYVAADKVFDVNGCFKVYGDGHLEGTDAHFTGGSTFEGKITATGGTIGGLDVEEWNEMTYSVRIESSNGNILKNNPTTLLTATLYKGVTPCIGTVTEKKNGQDTVFEISYQWYCNNAPVTSEEGGNDQELNVSLEGDNVTAHYTCKITLTPRVQGS